jgi:hypothetical protein
LIPQPFIMNPGSASATVRAGYLFYFTKLPVVLPRGDQGTWITGQHIAADGGHAICPLY